MKTRKIMDIDLEGRKIVCIKHFGSSRPYWVYLEWYGEAWGGGGDIKTRRRKLGEYSTMALILQRLAKYAEDHAV